MRVNPRGSYALQIMCFTDLFDMVRLGSGENLTLTNSEKTMLMEPMLIRGSHFKIYILLVIAGQRESLSWG